MSMSHQVKTKINRLIAQWPKGTVGVASYLNSLGFGHDLLVKYKKSGWIESFGRGAYILNGAKVEWPGALYAFQTQLNLNVHAGGKTSLELKGYAHYLPSQQKKIFLYGPLGQVLPTWFKRAPLGIDIVMTRTNLFPSDVQEGFSDYAERDFSIKISSPERAALEMLHLVPRKVSFEEASLILENLVSLRPEVVERLLFSCRSIKVKRLFLYMAEKHEHPWLPQLDLSRVDLGHGKRMLVSNGRYEKKYRITVPRDRQEEVSG
jgi:Transcriptional regulator, AbiEi antitoxin, Type IV TA system/Transcriptional regulator, AbiEi antitoxin N-terminal domain